MGIEERYKHGRYSPDIHLLNAFIFRRLREGNGNLTDEAKSLLAEIGEQAINLGICYVYDNRETIRRTLINTGCPESSVSLLRCLDDDFELPNRPSSHSEFYVG